MLILQVVNAGRKKQKNTRKSAFPKKTFQSKQGQMSNKLRQFRVEDICKGKSAGVKIKVTYRSS